MKKLFMRVSINKQKIKWNSKEEKHIQVNILNVGNLQERERVDLAEKIIYNKPLIN
jgi:hypothetical protein